MRRGVDLKGQRFGKLVALKRVPSMLHRHAVWLCQCDCGKRHKVTSWNLKGGRTKSCGCTHSQPRPEKRTQGGLSRHRVYSIWKGMLRRCEDPKHVAYYKYGMQGVKVCERWHTFLHFVNDLGLPIAGETLDRIDNSKGYEPGNVRWVSISEQNRNRRGWKKLS